jgi:hypothetical protein
MWESVKGVFVAHYGVFKDFAGPAVAIAGVAITGLLTLRGLNSFERWRRERIEERRIQVAIDALAIAREAMIAFAAVRGSGVGSHEYADMSDPSNPDTQGVYKRDQTGPYVVLRRLRRYDEFFERAAKLEPLYVAVFDDQAGDEFALLFKARQLLESVASLLFDDGRIELDPQDQQGRNDRRDWRANMYGTEGKGNVSETLQQFKDSVQARCRPVVKGALKAK